MFPARQKGTPTKNPASKGPGTKGMLKIKDTDWLAKEIVNFRLG